MTCCLRSLIAIRLDNNGTLINMSRLNTIAPGDVSIVWLIEHLIACMHDANALSIILLTSFSLVGGFTWSNTLNVSDIVLWLLSTMPFDIGFFTVVGFDSTPVCTSRFWNSCPINSPPLSWIHLDGHGYRDSQTLDNCCAMFSLVLLLILTISIKLVTGSIIVSALNVSSVSLIVIFHGPIRSTAISCHGAAFASLAARCPIPRPLNLCLQQLSGHWYYLHITDNRGW